MSATNSDILLIKKLSVLATIPTRGSPQAAGLDLFSAETCFILPYGKKMIKTDIAISLPFGTYGRIAPRSGLAAEKFLTIGGGVCDSDYRGNIIVIMFNHSPEIVNINVKDKIAQLIIEKISFPIVQETLCLDETSRNFAGFGSTG